MSEIRREIGKAKVSYGIGLAVGIGFGVVGGLNSSFLESLSGCEVAAFTIAENRKIKGVSYFDLMCSAAVAHGFAYQISKGIARTLYLT